MDNQKKEYNRMKHNLEKWRELILVLHSVLKWEKNYFPGVIVGGVLSIFLFLWYMDLTFVTTIALVGLIVTLFDYFYPKLARMIFKADKWRGPEEKKFELVAEEIFHLRNWLVCFWQFVQHTKSEKSTLFILGTSTVCVILAWIGSTVNNQLLALLVTLCVLLLPGARHKGYFDVIETSLAGRFGCIAKAATIGDAKKEK